jgi:hypothetical protein
MTSNEDSRQVWRNPRRHRSEAGYALVLIMFFLALLVLSMAEAAPTLVSRIQREREAEMVWRGKQYTRGVRMYYIKMKRFPTSLDDLTKPKTGIRFMRQAYKDPMNQVDGSWRLIYVGPNGQLIGSLNKYTIGSSGMTGVSSIAGASSSGSSLFPAGNGQGLASGASPLSSSAIGSGPFGGSQSGVLGTAMAAGTSVGNQNATNSNSETEDSDQPQSLAGPMDASNTFGGNIIGVGSKINKKSFMVYQKAKNYRLFEFVWDPSKDMTVGGASAGIGAPVQNFNNLGGPNGPGMASTDSSLGLGINPGQNHNQNPGPTQNPPQNSIPGSNPDPNQVPPPQALAPNQ